MKKPDKAYTVLRFRLYPTKDQEQLLAQMFGNTRFLYNQLLGLCQETYELNQPYPNKFGLINQIPTYRKLYPFLKRISSNEAMHVCTHLDKSFQNFFQKKAGFPRFKKKTNRQSLTCSQRIKLTDNLLKIEGISGLQVHFDKRSHLVPNSQPKLATITKVPSGKYFVSLTWDTGATLPVPYVPTNIVAYDEGIASLCTSSYGRKLANPRSLAKHAARLRRNQRKQAKAQKGSNRRRRLNQRIARTHEKISNTRKFKITTFVTHEVRKAKAKNQGIAIQTSPKQNQLQNRKLSKALSDASNGLLIATFKQVAKRAGVPLLEISQWQSTSKTCHHCDFKKEDLTLKDRKWKCPQCGLLHDRDINAAKVIEKLAHQQLRGETASMHASSGRGSKEPPMTAKTCQVPSPRPLRVSRKSKRTPRSRDKETTTRESTKLLPQNSN
jgi:putative transposase